MLMQRDTAITQYHYRVVQVLMGSIMNSLVPRPGPGNGAI